MSAPFNPYAPHPPAAEEVIAYVRRAIDQLMRSNPLQNAVVSTGLIRWIGNYTNSGNPDKVNFLWVGEFLPADPDMGGRPQRGFSLVRDDSRGGVSALAMWDPTPDIGNSGLRQVLIMTSGDGQRLMEESRNGGQRWPESNVPMAPLGTDLGAWPGTTEAAFSTVWEGRINIVGNQVAYRVFCVNETGVSSEHRIRVEIPGAEAVGATHTLGVGAQTVFDSTVNVAAGRGQTCAIRWEARRTAGVNPNTARSSVITMRCYST